MAPVTFCSSSLPVYGVKSRLIVTLGATCLYWSTSVRSVPPCVPGSVPFMPCQKVMVTGAPVAAGLATAVATPDTAVAATGATAVATAATVGAAAARVGATAVAAALTLVAAGATCVGAAGAALVQAIATRHTTSGSRLKTYMIDAPSAFQAAAGDALQELTLDENEQDDHRRDGERARRHQRVVVRPVLEGEGRQPDLDGSHLRPAGHHQRPQEALPALHERVQPHREQGRCRERHDHPPQVREVAGAVDLAGLPQLVRDTEKELAQQEDREHTHPPRHGDRGERVEPPGAFRVADGVHRDRTRQIGQQHEVRDERHFL